jgi:hypothetical protein
MEQGAKRPFFEEYFKHDDDLMMMGHHQTRNQNTSVTNENW